MEINMVESIRQQSTPFCFLLTSINILKRERNKNDEERNDVEEKKKIDFLFFQEKIILIGDD